MKYNAPNSVSADGHGWVLDNRFSILLAIMMAVLIVMNIIPQGFDYKGTPDSGSALYRLLLLSLLGSGSIFVLWRIGLGWLLLRNTNPFLLFFIILAIASFAWSIDHSLTGRRLFRLIITFLVCAAFVLSGWHARRFQNILRPITTLLLLGSIIFVLVDPANAIHWEKEAELYGAWHGLTTQKNGLGALACFGVILWYHAWLNREVKLRYALVGITIAAICLINSRSNTSNITAVVTMIIMTLIMRAPLSLRPYRTLLVIVLSTVLVVYALAILNIVPGLDFILNPIMSLTGKDMTFSSRSIIWEIIKEHISIRPFFGSGYEAYWTAGPIPGHESFVFPSLMQGFYPGSSHNGYLEVMNDLGWVGLIVLVGYLAIYIRQSIQLMSIDNGQAALYIGIFFQQAVTNLFESNWFDVGGFSYIFMMLATMALGRSLLEFRMRFVFGDPHSYIDGKQNDLNGRMQSDIR